MLAAVTEKTFFINCIFQRIVSFTSGKIFNKSYKSDKNTDPTLNTVNSEKIALVKFLRVFFAISLGRKIKIRNA